MNIKSVWCVLLFVADVLQVQAQSPDTVQLTLPQAEAVFLQNNLSLLAAQYGVDAAQAQVRQARLWDNPTLSTDQNLYDGRFFNHGKGGSANNTSGQVYVQVQQLIRTGGKISKLAALASTNAAAAQLQLQQLLRNLRYDLHTNFYQAAQAEAGLKLYNQEAVQVNKLLEGMQAQLKLGNISQKELLRIQALQLSLLQSIGDGERNLSAAEAELHTLLPTFSNAHIRPVVETEATPQTAPLLDSLLAAAHQNNPDYLLQQTSLKYGEQALKYQHALRLPDITTGIEYDKASSYVPNYVGLTVALPLPLFNRNQGNIAAASFTVKQQQSTLGAAEQKLRADIENALQQWQIAQRLQAATDADFSKKYTALLQNAIAAYQQKQLGLLEFIDLFEAYKNSQLQLLQEAYNAHKSAEDLNLLTGTTVVH